MARGSDAGRRATAGPCLLGGADLPCAAAAVTREPSPVGRNAHGQRRRSHYTPIRSVPAPFPAGHLSVSIGTDPVQRRPGRGAAHADPHAGWRLSSARPLAWATRTLRQSLAPARGDSAHLAPLDGLRGFAVLSVVLLHTLELSRSPFLVRNVGAWNVLGTGVELFFVLSGFLLFLPYARSALIGSRLPSLRRYFKRRALRILPAYWASLCIFLLFLSPPGFNKRALQNIFLHFTLLHNYNASTFQAINGPYWTMAVEAQFYLLLPLLALALVSALRARRRILVVVLVGGVAVLSLIAEVAVYTATRSRTRFASHAPLLAVFQYLPVFLAGVLASIVFVAVSRRGDTDALLRRAIRVVGACGIATLLVSAEVNRHLWSHPASGYVLAQVAGLAYAGILLACLLGWESWARWLSNPTIRFVGLISYSVYIWNRVLLHRAVAPLVRLFITDTGPLFEAAMILVGALIILPVSIASYLLCERPFIHLGSSGRTERIADLANAHAAP